MAKPDHLAVIESEPNQYGVTFNSGTGEASVPILLRPVASDACLVTMERLYVGFDPTRGSYVHFTDIPVLSQCEESADGCCFAQRVVLTDVPDDGNPYLTLWGTTFHSFSNLLESQYGYTNHVAIGPSGPPGQVRLREPVAGVHRPGREVRYIWEHTPRALEHDIEIWDHSRELLNPNDWPPPLVYARIGLTDEGDDPRGPNLVANGVVIKDERVHFGDDSELCWQLTPWNHKYGLGDPGTVGCFINSSNSAPEPATIIDPVQGRTLPYPPEGTDAVASMRFNLGYGTFGFWLESSNSPRFDDPDITRREPTEIRNAFSDDDITAEVGLARTAGHRFHFRIGAYNSSGTTYSETRWFENPVGLACARPKLCAGTTVRGHPVSGLECCYDDLGDTLRLADVARSADLGNPHNLGTARIGGFPAIVTYDAQAYAATGDARLATPASPAGNFGADFVQQQAVSVQTAATFWYEWILTRWAINSFEDAPVSGLGAPIRAYVNLTTDRNGNPLTDNADADGLSRTIGFFVPGPRGRVTAGMPEGVWHELFHLLINRLTGGALANGWEAAAIQEALADFGACVGKVYDGVHNNAAFTMRMLRTDGSFPSVRHLRNPKSATQLDGRIYPTKYVNDPDWCPESQAGACDFEYTNSLPLSHALVNLAIRGPHPDTGIFIPTVGALGVENTFGAVLDTLRRLPGRTDITMLTFVSEFMDVLGGEGTPGGDLAQEVFAAHGFLGGGPIGTPPPQPTPTPPPCRSGDCDGSGSVEIDDLIKATNVALGLQPVTACSAADADGNGQVQVDEILAAVGLSLSGCGGGSGNRLAAAGDPLPSPTPTQLIAQPVAVQLRPGDVDARSGVAVSIPLYVADSVAGNHVQGLLFDLSLPSVLDPAFCFLDPALDAAFTLTVATPMPGITRLLVLPRTYPTSDVIPDGLFARCATRTKENSLIDTYPIVVSNVSVATLGTPEDMVVTRNGKLRITSGTGSNLTLSGRVTYFRSPTSEPAPVPGVRVTLWPRNEFSRKAVTDNAGTFSFTGLERLDQHLTVRKKSAGAAAAAGFADAAWVLDAVVGNRLLGPEETVAADVTGDGTVSHIDALRILENAVARATKSPQTPFPVSERCNVDFILLPSPSTQPNQRVDEPVVSPQWCSLGRISYAPLGGSAGDQDFVAVAAGDVTGDWPVATGLMEPPPPAPGEDWEPTEAAVEIKAAERLSRIDSAIVRLRDASAEEMPFTSLTRREASRVKSAYKRLTHALAVATKRLVREHDMQ